MNNNFTIEDIHNIRYLNYEKTKDLNPDQLIKISIEKSDVILKRLIELKKLNGGRIH